MTSIRDARADDLEEIAEIERSAASLFRDVGLAWIADADPLPASELHAMLEKGTLWVSVDHTDRPTGFLTGYPIGADFYIAEMSVARAHQRKGIGADLLTAALNFARHHGFDRATLMTYRDLHWNKPFYARLGFVEVDMSVAAFEYRKKLSAEVSAGHDPKKRCLMVKALWEALR
jgi:GNAT superfamily N-acetyltransferase